MKLTILNKTRNTHLGSNIELAETPFSRLKGLLGRASLDEGSGLLIAPCNSIHMFFMRFAIDVAFLDKDNQVVRAIHSIRPWRATRFYPRAESALELPAGTLKRTQTEDGDQLEIFVPEEGENVPEAVATLLQQVEKESSKASESEKLEREEVAQTTENPSQEFASG